MRKTKSEILILGFALFSMFFGAGNLIFPPTVGVKVGTEWVMASFGFFLTGICLPLLGILAFTKIGNLDEFANKVSPFFNKLYTTVLILVIGPLFAIPRTGSTTFEMGVLPLFKNADAQVLSIVTAVIFFSLTLFLVINKTIITDILGKFLTPIILIILSLIAIIGFTTDLGTPITPELTLSPFSFGFTSGYQTMDALASVLFGVIIIKGLKDKGITEEGKQKFYLANAGIVSALGLSFIYISLIYLGAKISGESNLSTAQTTLILAEKTLGVTGKFAFGICVAIACLTTSVGLVALASEWFSKLLNISYKLIAIIISIFSAIISIIGLDSLIKLSIPVLILLYPLTIVLIFLNIFGIKSKLVFRVVVFVTLTISILETIKYDISFIPLADAGFAWFVPVIITFIVTFIINKLLESSKK